MAYDVDLGSGTCPSHILAEKIVFGDEEPILYICLGNNELSVEGVKPWKITVARLISPATMSSAVNRARVRYRPDVGFVRCMRHTSKYIVAIEHPRIPLQQSCSTSIGREAIRSNQLSIFELC